MNYLIGDFGHGIGVCPFLFFLGAQLVTGSSPQAPLRAGGDQQSSAVAACGSLGKATYP